MAINEFRQDLVSGEWVLFATGRAKNSARAKPVVDPAYAAIDKCPFEDLVATGNEPVWYFPNRENWQIALIKNKFPAVAPGICQAGAEHGPYKVFEAVGFHDVFVYRDHNKYLADFSKDEMVNLIRAYKKRYAEIAATDGCLEYILIFHNSGKDAGASLYHPHSQLISSPILPPDVSRSVRGAEKYFKDHGKNVYDVIIDWELKAGSRIVYENDKFIILCPYASKTPYETRIYPKGSGCSFESLPEDQDSLLADALSTILKKIKNGLANPAFNMFIHTAPVGAVGSENFYRWHMEILPKINVAAGFEIGTGVNINVVDPDDAAKLLRETNV